MPLSRPKVCVICEELYDDENSYFEHIYFAHEFTKYDEHNQDEVFNVKNYNCNKQTNNEIPSNLKLHKNEVSEFNF